MFIVVFSPIRMMAPLPYCFSTCARAISSAFACSVLIVLIACPFRHASWLVLTVWDVC